MGILESCCSKRNNKSKKKYEKDDVEIKFFIFKKVIYNA
jgi:hypothetical protein